MSANDAARRVREKFRLGRPPGVDGAKMLFDAIPGRPGRKRKAEKMAQLNLRVPQAVKDRVRILAARDRIEMSEVIMEGIQLYEAKYGVAPTLEPGRPGK